MNRLCFFSLRRIPEIKSSERHRRQRNHNFRILSNTRLTVLTWINVRRSFRVAKKLESKDRSPNDDPKSPLFVLRLSEKMGKSPKEMLSYVEDLKKQGIKLDHSVYEPILSRYEQASDLIGMWELFKSLKNEGIKLGISTYSIVIVAFLKHGHFAKANQVFDNMCEEGIKPDANLYTLMISANAHAENLKRTWELFTAMKNEELEPEPETHKTVLALLQKVGLSPKEMENLKEKGPELLMIKAKQSLEDYHQIIQDSGKRGNVEEVLKAYREMIKARMEPTSVTKNLIFHELYRNKATGMAWTFFKMLAQQDRLDRDCYREMRKIIFGTN